MSKIARRTDHGSDGQRFSAVTLLLHAAPLGIEVRTLIRYRIVSVAEACNCLQCRTVDDDRLGWSISVPGIVKNYYCFGA
jgi:hypothetical protein